MNNTEIRDALSRLHEMEFYLEEVYENNGGEVTDYTEAQEAEISALKALLTNEGVDSLGRWLKSLEDKKTALKKEKDYLSRQIDKIDSHMDYVKQQIHTIMVAANIDKVKGINGYSFAPTTSVKTSVDKELLKTNYEERIKDALFKAFIPSYIGVTLTASATKAKEFGVVEGDEGLFSETSTPSVRFTKPRASKEEE